MSHSTRRPVAARLDLTTLQRSGESCDNFSMARHADGTLIVCSGDGSGWRSPGKPAVSYATSLWKLSGYTWAEITQAVRAPYRATLISGFPEYPFPAGWFGYGVRAVGNRLICAISRCPADIWSGPFEGVRLLVSDDDGVSWTDHTGEDAKSMPVNSKDPDRMFFWHEGEDWRFNSLEFLQIADNDPENDGYLYVYGPAGKNPHQLLLARVRPEDVLKRSEWRYCVGVGTGKDAGEAVWSTSADCNLATPIHNFPIGWGWYSWLPSVIWVAELGFYVMATGGTERLGDSWMHDRTGSLHLLWADKPWGPWHLFHRDDDWIADSPENRLYQPKLVPLTKTDRPEDLMLVFSDAQSDADGRSHAVNYRWNEVRLHLEMTDL